MQIEFTKMNGAGNDFVVLDNRCGRYDGLDAARIARLCDRHRGVGADGLLAVEAPRPDSRADFTFRYHNADGGEAEMCGNGARCFARFARAFLAAGRGSMVFDTQAGPVEAAFDGELVSIRLSDPHDFRLNLELPVDGRVLAAHFVNTGVPHVVVPVADLAAVDVRGLGAALRHHAAFQPRGTNANFLQVLAPGRIAVRTYERGVEDETLACGTGVVANALVHHLTAGVPAPVEVSTRGGDRMRVDFEPRPGGGFGRVTLTGPADFVFTGSMNLA
jgi:diaminopimelate epimerase